MGDIRGESLARKWTVEVNGTEDEVGHFVTNDALITFLTELARRESGQIAGWEMPASAPRYNGSWASATES